MRRGSEAGRLATFTREERRVACHGFIQEAIAHYSTALDAEQAREERSERIGKAIDKMREAATRMPPRTDGAAIIRRFRDMPPRWLDQEDEEHGR